MGIACRLLHKPCSDFECDVDYMLKAEAATLNLLSGFGNADESVEQGRMPDKPRHQESTPHRFD